MKLGRLFSKRLKSARCAKPSLKSGNEGKIAVERLVNTLTSLVITSGYKRVDAFVLCELCSKIGYVIQTEKAPDLPPKVTAIAVKLKGRYLILYRPSISLISVQISVLHELCHILLNHCSFTMQDIEAGRSFYTDEQEAEAERDASILLCRLATITPKENWGRNILKGQIALSSPSPSIQRLMELMQDGAPILNGTKNRFLSFRIMRVKQLLS